MEIGIIGVGHIGKTLALKLASAGHNLTVANSRGPENIIIDNPAQPVQSIEVF